MIKMIATKAFRLRGKLMSPGDEFEVVGKRDAHLRAKVLRHGRIAPPEAPKPAPRAAVEARKPVPVQPEASRVELHVEPAKPVEVEKKSFLAESGTVAKPADDAVPGLTKRAYRRRDMTAEDTK